MRAPRAGIAATLLCVLILSSVSVIAEPPLCNTRYMNMNMNTRSAFVVTDCDTPSGGTPPPPPPPGRFNAVFNDVWITEFENPLERFQVLTPSDEVGDRRVVNLQPIPYTPNTQEQAGTIISLTDANIASLVDTFGLTRADMAHQLDTLFETSPALQAVADDATLKVLEGKFHEAAQILMAQPTPADTRYWCGPNGNPAFVDWVLVIPVSLTCQQGALGTSLGVVTSVIAVDAGDPSDPTRTPEVHEDGRVVPLGITLAFAATSTSTTTYARHVAGFTYAQWSMGANTTLGKSWSLNAQLGGLRMLDDKTAHLNWSSGLQGAIGGTPSFSADDSLVATYEGKLGQGRTIDSTLRASMLAGQWNLSVRNGATPDGFRVEAEPDPALANSLKWHEVVLTYPSGHAIVGRAAALTGNLVIQTSQGNANGGIQHIATFDGGTQRANVTADTAEIKLTYYRGTTAIATVQTLAIPEKAIFLFDDGEGSPGESTTHFDLGGSMGYYRTALLTTHAAGTLDVSITGDYTKRVFTMGGPKPNLINNADSPWDIHGGTIPSVTAASWARMLSARASVWDAGSYVTLTYTPAINNLAYEVGFPPPAGDPTPVNSNHGTLIQRTPTGVQHYVWGTNTYTDPGLNKACPEPLRIADEIGVPRCR